MNHRPRLFVGSFREVIVFVFVVVASVRLVGPVPHAQPANGHYQEEDGIVEDAKHMSARPVQGFDIGSVGFFVDDRIEIVEVSKVGCLDI